MRDPSPPERERKKRGQQMVDMISAREHTLHGHCTYQAHVLAHRSWPTAAAAATDTPVLPSVRKRADDPVTLVRSHHDVLVCGR